MTHGTFWLMSDVGRGNRPRLDSWQVSVHLAHTKRVARHPSPGAAGPAAGSLAQLAMIATAISKSVEADHVIAYRATDFGQHGLHELTLN